MLLLRLKSAVNSFNDLAQVAHYASSWNTHHPPPQPSKLGIPRRIRRTA
jgi:hypothetical protein